MGYEHRRSPARPQDFRHIPLELLPQPRIQIGKRLIQQQNIRPRRQRPAQRHPLLLPPRKLMRHPPAQPRKPHQIQRFPDTPPAIPILPQPIANILLHRKMRKQRPLLKHHPDAPPFRGQPTPRRTNHPPPDRDFPRIRPLETRDQPQSRSLAAPARPQQRQDLPRLQRQIQPIHRRHRPKTLNHPRATQSKPIPARIRSRAAPAHCQHLYHSINAIHPNLSRKTNHRQRQQITPTSANTKPRTV